MAARGKFIVFEGIDGCGKSTQIERLAASLTDMGRSVVTTAEPTGSESGKMLRRALSGAEPRSAAEMAALFVLDRIHHNVSADGIEALLAAGRDVVCDRYYYSSLAYQGSLVDYDWVRRMNCDCPDIRRPDVCIFLDLEPKISLARIAARGAQKEIYETEEKLTLFRETFMKVFSTLQGENIAVINADGTPDEVAARVLAAVRTVL